MPRANKGAKGFKKLCGKLVYKIDDRACNVVIIETGEGQRYEIHADVLNCIPVLSLVKHVKETECL